MNAEFQNIGHDLSRLLYTEANQHYGSTTPEGFDVDSSMSIALC